MFTEIPPGESLLINCNSCDREFTLTFEPKAADMTFREKRAIESAPFKGCPFCLNTKDNFDIEQT